MTNSEYVRGVQLLMKEVATGAKSADEASRILVDVTFLYVAHKQKVRMKTDTTEVNRAYARASAS